MSTSTESLNLQLKLSGLAAVEAGVKQVANTIGSLKNVVLGLGAGFAGLATIGGLEHLAEQVLDLGSELTNLKARIGATIPELMAMRRMLTEAGGDAGDVALLLGHMQRAIVDAAEKGGALEKVFTDIHLNVATLSAMTPGEQFRAIGEGIAGLNDEAKKTEVAMSVFGRSGAQLKAVFADVQKFQQAFNTQSPFVVAMARSSEMFHSLETNLTRFKENGLRIMAGFLDQLVPLFSDKFDELGAIDLTPIGQKIGAFFAVIIQSIRDDKFPEMVALLIESGFELGGLAAQQIWDKTWQFLGSNAVASLEGAVANAVMTFGVQVAKAILNIITTLATYVGTAFEYALDNARAVFTQLGKWLKEMFLDVVNFFVHSFEWAINKIIHGLNVIPHLFHGKGMSDVSFGKLNTSSSPTEPGESWAQAFEKNSSTAAGYNKDIQKYLDDQLAASRQILTIGKAITGEDIARLPALERLNALIEAQMKKRADMAAHEEAIRTVTPGLSEAQQLRAFDEQELQLKQKLLDITTARERVESNFRMSEQEKYAARKKLLDDEKATTEQIIALLLKKADLLDKVDPTRGDAARKQAFSEQQKIPGIVKGQEKTPDPQSFSEQFDATLASLKSKLGTWQQQAAQSFATVFEGAISSVSKGIMALIEGTKTWGEALRDIGRNILLNVINAIVEMGVRWVAMEVLHTIVGVAGAKERTLANAQEAGAKGVAAGAGAASSVADIPYVGWALALAAFASVVSTVAGGNATPSYAAGGYTGAGGKHEMAGIVHKGEYIFDADATSRIGVGRLESIRSGDIDSASGGGSGVTVQGHKMSVAFVNSRSEMREYLQSAEGEKHIVDIARRRRVDIGVNT